MVMREHFASGEWYHCYNRGVDKRLTFPRPRDYERFLMLMYACNSSDPLRISNLGQSKQGPTLLTVLGLERAEPLVDIAAYSLMPNHFHLLLRETAENGITAFMRKLCTGYVMYFNIKHERTGALFGGKFKSRHVATDQYFSRVINYIHANPAELREPDWKQGGIRNEPHVRAFLKTYTYSSLPEYLSITRPQATIVNMPSVLEILEHLPSLDDLIEEARIYAQESPLE